MSMKKLLIIVLALASLVQANAQIVPGMKYKQVKDMYDTKMYVPQSIDPYNKTIASVVSFFAPGVSQMCMGEFGRGVAFFAGEVVLLEIVKSSAETFSKSVITDETGKVTGYNDEQAAKTSVGFFIGGLVADLALCIWSSCDAAKVAKVKNMYYQDLRRMRSSVDFDFAPFFTYAPTAITASGSSLTPTAGLSMRVSF